MSVVRVEVKLSLLTAVRAAWNMNSSTPEGGRVPIPLEVRTSRVNWSVTVMSGGTAIHRRLLLPTTVQVKTTESFGQAAPSPELDVN